MNKKAILLGVLMSLLASGAFAQDFHLGLQVGANVSSLTGEDVATYVSGGSLTNKIGAVGGVILQLDLSAMFAISLEPYYTQKGILTSSGGDTTFDLAYVSVPLMLKYYIPLGPVKPSIQAGGSVSFNTLANAVNDGGTTALTDIAATDVGVIAGVGLEIDKFLINIRYEIGLTDVSTDPAVLVQNGTLSAMIGYFFM
jgi:hypothetical protein